ncbi:HEAT repeat domain-containing protein [Streptomyces sp. NPDC058595]|uniref:HEAT repeat domain-containing protein n=1 Tax=Streptomyces sp. NPDC058595 TaxID=3346550 RepID=UPI0036664B93
MEIEEFVQLASGRGAGAAKAAERLVEFRERALQPIIDFLSDPWAVHGNLPGVLERILLNAPRDEVVRALSLDQDAVFEAAVQVIQEQGMEAWRNEIVERLCDRSESEVRRARIAEICGDMASPSIGPHLEAVFAQSQRIEREEDEPPRLTVECAVALAKLGDFRFGSPVIELLTHSFPPTREMAAEAAKILVGEGMIEILSRAIRDSSLEVRLQVVEALFLLGFPACVDALIEGLNGGDLEIGNNCRVRLNDILGTKFQDSPEGSRALIRYWSQSSSQFDECKRYRLGVASSVGEIIEVIDVSPHRSHEIGREILYITGRRLRVGSTYFRDQAQRLSSLFGVRGATYRWGHQVAPNLIFG